MYILSCFFHGLHRQKNRWNERFESDAKQCDVTLDVRGKRTSQIRLTARSDLIPGNYILYNCLGFRCRNEHIQMQK